MGSNKLQFTANINSSPTAVINFVADVRNRMAYQEALTSVSHVVGDAGVGQSWSWRYELAGTQLEGTGKGVEFEAGKLYAFETEGAVASRFAYRAEPLDDGTQITIEVEFDVPAELEQKTDIQSLLLAAKEKGDSAVAQLKQAIEK